MCCNVSGVKSEPQVSALSLLLLLEMYMCENKTTLGMQSMGLSGLWMQWPALERPRAGRSPNGIERPTDTRSRRVCSRCCRGTAWSTSVTGCCSSRSTIDDFPRTDRASLRPHGSRFDSPSCNATSPSRRRATLATCFLPPVP